MLRNVSQMNATGNFVILIVLCVIGWFYYVTYYLCWFVKVPVDIVSAWFITYTVVFHVFSFLLFWSFLTSIFADPGRVPKNWGFFLNEEDFMHRRYCLICCTFKPDRCHHCSKCGRCVLNMDHHCPWINNCVGFYNKKFFILLLFYSIVTLMIAQAGMIRTIIFIYRDFFWKKSSEIQWYTSFSILMAMLLSIVLEFSLYNLLTYHIHLIFKNRTTIEAMSWAQNQQQQSQFMKTYNFGKQNNWKQIFGRNVLLWPFPIFFSTGRPIGDGVFWPENYLKQQQQQQGYQQF